MGIALDTSLAVMSESNVGFGFFCSNRYSNTGCGGTFSLLWSHLLTRSSLCSAEIMRLIREVSTSAESLHHLWWKGGYTMSLSTVYRYWKKWRRSFGHLRAQLSRDHPPPEGEGVAEAHMVLHLEKAFGEDSTSWVAAFQERCQRDFFA